MRGHIEIIKTRLMGKRPAIVFLNDYYCKTDWFENNDHATVCTAGDALSGIDLRFLKGCTVSISAITEARAKAIFAKVKDAGAAVVAACHVRDDQRPWEQTGWAEVWREQAAQETTLEAAHG